MLPKSPEGKSDRGNSRTRRGRKWKNNLETGTVNRKKGKAGEDGKKRKKSQKTIWPVPASTSTVFNCFMFVFKFMFVGRLLVSMCV